MENLSYRLGGLLYMPAFQNGIIEKILQKKLPCLHSVAFCLEDSIRDTYVKEAELALEEKLNLLSQQNTAGKELPLIFVRIRSPEHMRHLYDSSASVRAMAAGFILPKFDLGNAAPYLQALKEFNADRNSRLYAMPILESSMIASLQTRKDTLIALKDMLDEVKPLIPNIRVGGNDFCNLYGLRHSVHQTIYDIGPIRDILMDILNVFSRDYVVSGPVWNYFGPSSQKDWQEGLQRELALDRLNGFIGKTAIHPVQLPLIHQSLAVTREDYEDACALLDWKSEKSGVSKSANGSRMNEVKCHQNWARRIKILKDIYGFREECHADCNESDL